MALVCELEEKDGQIMTYARDVRAIVADLTRGALYVSDGNIHRITFLTSDVMDVELKKVEILAHFPPGVRPIILAYVANVPEGVEVIYQSTLMENRAREQTFIFRTHHEKEKGAKWPVSKMAMDLKTGHLVATLAHHPTTKIIRIDTSSLYRLWESWKHASEIKGGIGDITTDNAGGFYFMQGPYEDTTIRHVSGDGWVTNCVSTNKDESARGLRDENLQTLIVSCRTQHVYILAGPRQRRALHYIEECLTTHHEYGDHKVVCSLPRGSIEKIQIAFGEHRQNHLLGYLFIVAGKSNPPQYRLYHLPISTFLFDMVPHGVKRRRTRET